MFLNGRYEVQDRIGRGSTSTVYRGRDMLMGRDVAIKVLNEHYSIYPEYVERFQQKAKKALALQHPNIIEIYDYGQSDGTYFMVMELIEGKGTDLRRYLRSRGVLSTDRASIIAHDVALGLGVAHRRGIVHGYVIPQHVLVGHDGSIKLTAFGMEFRNRIDCYAPGHAEEDISNPASDIYALGCVMYEMLTGRPPFDGDTPVAVAMQHIQDAPIPPSQFNPTIPVAMEKIILRCLEKEPEMRYRDGGALARALEMLDKA